MQNDSGRSLLAAVPHAAAARPPGAPRARRSPAFAFFCMYAAFVAYATLLPFQFFHDRASLAAKAQLVNWDPRYLTTGEETPLTDLVANVLFFIPVGFIGVHAQRPRRAFGLILRSTAAGLALSVGVEMAQFFTPSRNPATSDVLTNSLGALLGAGLAVFVRTQIEHTLLRRASAWTRREPLLPILAAFALLVAVASFVPFDFLLSVSGLRAAVRRAQLGLQASAWHWVDEIPRLLQFTVLAGLAWFASRTAFHAGRVRGSLLCVLSLAGFAVSLELGQLVVRSHVCSAVDAVAALWGVAAGISIAAVLMKTARTHYGWWMVGLACVVSLGVQSLAPFQFDFSAAAVQARITPHALVPYSSYYYKATVAAVADFLDGLLAFVPLGFVLARAWARPQAGGVRTGLRVGTACAGIALVFELLQLGMPKRYPEISDVLTAALGGGLGAFAWGWFAALRAPVGASATARDVQDVAPDPESGAGDTNPHTARAGTAVA